MKVGLFFPADWYLSLSNLAIEYFLDFPQFHVWNNKLCHSGKFLGYSIQLV